MPRGQGAADEKAGGGWDPAGLGGHALVVADGSVLDDETIDDPLEVGLTDADVLPVGTSTRSTWASGVHTVKLPVCVPDICP